MNLDGYGTSLLQAYIRGLYKVATENKLLFPCSRALIAQGVSGFTVENLTINLSGTDSPEVPLEERNIKSQLLCNYLSTLLVLAKQDSNCVAIAKELKINNIDAFCFYSLEFHLAEAEVPETKEAETLDPKIQFTAQDRRLLKALKIGLEKKK